MAKDKRRTGTGAVGRKLVDTHRKVIVSGRNRSNNDYSSEESDEEQVRIRRMHFRFFDLPPELRLRIYEEVLIQKTPIDLGMNHANR